MNAPDVYELLSQPAAPMYPFRWREKLFWLESLSAEGGRNALMQGAQCLTPAAFNIRSNAHEYGGACHCVCGGYFIFNNYADGRLYAQKLTTDATENLPFAITAKPPPGQTTCFADLIPIDERAIVIAVMESGGDELPDRDYLVAINMSLDDEATPQVLAQGADFYACPALSADRSQVAWMEWDNPFMPWDESRLVRADLAFEDGEVSLKNHRVVLAENSRAVCQLGFIGDDLWFVSDGGDSDFWNFFRAGNDDQITQVTDDEYEYGEAQWQFGQRRWRAIGDDKIIAVGSGGDGDCLLEIDARGDTKIIADGCAVCANLYADNEARELLFIARYADRDAEIRALKYNDKTGADRALHGTAGLKEFACSQPRAIAFPTRDGDRAYGYFYPPVTREADAKKPPLIIMIHGGPTARATPEWHPVKQFFAAQGFAVLDINHRGSTGYGRAYRQRLLGEWGEVDATDIADGVAYAVRENLADPRQVFIRGGSAGGYAVLRALTRFPDLFCGGACYYGIGNLITLAHITHKFEGYYTDRLIGEKFQPDKKYDAKKDATSRFVLRSPVFHLQQLNCPLILFQGLQDKVVPPALSREVVALLKRKGIRHEYIEYADEGHGFRGLNNRVDSLTREAEFFASIIK